jgi:putative membrane protein
MFRTIAATLSLALIFSSAAWAQDPAQQSDAAAQDQQQQDQQQQQQQRESQAGAAAAAEAQPAAATDAEAEAAAGRDQGQQDPTQMFVKETYSSNLFEIQAGQLAAQRAQDDQIKQFARMMVEDHTKANQQLKQAAQSKQIQVQEQLDPVHQAKLQKLQKLPAQEFGRKYINGQVAGHMVNVLEFQYQSQNLQDPQLKQWATQTLPKLEEHLKHATQIASKQAGGQARTAGERESGGATSGQDASQPRSGADASNESGTSSGQSGAGTSGQSDQAGKSDTAGQQD